jgi:hypothetical protein
LLLFVFVGRHPAGKRDANSLETAKAALKGDIESAAEYIISSGTLVIPD